MNVHEQSRIPECLMMIILCYLSTMLKLGIDIIFALALQEFWGIVWNEINFLLFCLAAALTAIMREEEEERKKYRKFAIALECLYPILHIVSFAFPAILIYDSVL